jgi:hypothetical protein
LPSPSPATALSGPVRSSPNSSIPKGPDCSR